MRPLSLVALEGKHFPSLTLANIKSAILAAALASEAQLTVLATELERFTQLAEAIITFLRVFQVWAQRP